jgi:TPP-dependent pyruvate/acetoin dehydrogenase alpha subunit
MSNLFEIQKDLKDTYGLEVLRESELFKILQLFYVRHVEKFIVDNYHESLFRCPVHFSIGQEAVAVGVCSNLSSRDKIVSTHRCHAHYLAKGGDLASMFAEMMGKPSGCTKGRGGSMHLFDEKQGFYGSVPIVGSSLPIATGLGFAQKYNQDKNITVSFIGDAVFETGQFHESLNFISTFNIPILIVMENNRYSTYTPINARQSTNMNLEKVVTGIGIEYVKGNGDDLIQVDTLSKTIISKVRSGQPFFIEFDTYRRLEHCGPNLDDELGYRSINEIDSFSKRDPVNIIKCTYIERRDIVEAIKIFEEYLPMYLSKIYEGIKQLENIHPTLTENDSFQLL